MRKILVLLVVMLAACTTHEKEVVTTSVDVDQSELPALLSDVSELAENTIPVDEMLALAESTPMDDELQDRYAFKYEGSDEEIQYHVWREQTDWVHVYFSSTSNDLISAIEKSSAAYAREDDS